jgi:hypothetical protein
MLGSEERRLLVGLEEAKSPESVEIVEVERVESEVKGCWFPRSN